jgi:hypothetical protein
MSTPPVSNSEIIDKYKSFDIVRYGDNTPSVRVLIVNLGAKIFLETRNLKRFPIRVVKV